jgi:DNA-binding MarR family transcriptional regulator
MEIGDRYALDLWRDITNSAMRDNGPDLTARQTALLLTVHLDEERHTVRGLAKRLGLQKPAIVRAIDSLQSLGLINRVRDDNDKRNVFIEPTQKGAQKLCNIANIISQGLNTLPINSRFDIDNFPTNYAAQ